jgi:hypothetical protein
MGNKGKKQKIPLPLPPQKEKNWTIHECMMSLPIGYMKFLFPKLFPITMGCLLSTSLLCVLCDLLGKGKFVFTGF